VFALAVYNDELVAGGDFTFAGGLASARWARWGCRLCRGDLNCDGKIDLGDINPFVLYLSDNAVWQSIYPGCNPLNGDVNADGIYGQGSFGDINPFVSLLSSAPLPIPCP
jgi:hypothetical protein